MRFFVRIFVISFPLFFTAPAVMANDLACTAILCTLGGATCSNSMYPGCGPAINKLCKIDMVSKAQNWLFKCEFDDSKTVINYVTRCTKDNIFKYVNKGRFDVPAECKKYVQTYSLQNQNLLPVVSVGRIKESDLEGGWSYKVRHHWSYANKIPRGYTLVYNPNKLERRICPNNSSLKRKWALYSTRKGCGTRW